MRQSSCPTRDREWVRATRLWGFSGDPRGGRVERRSFGLLATFAAFVSYCHIVPGGTVRIADAEPGCGWAWPRCRAEWAPVFTIESFLPRSHRLRALLPVVIVRRFVHA
jgi:heme A synthase